MQGVGVLEGVEVFPTEVSLEGAEHEGYEPTEHLMVQAVLKTIRYQEFCY